jgi:hypothetical protein
MKPITRAAFCGCRFGARCRKGEGLVNNLRIIMYGIIVASFVLVSSGCYEWNQRGDYSGYDRVSSSYDRNDRR